MTYPPGARTFCVILLPPYEVIFNQSFIVSCSSFCLSIQLLHPIVLSCDFSGLSLITHPQVYPFLQPYLKESPLLASTLLLLSRLPQLKQSYAISSPALSRLSSLPCTLSDIAYAFQYLCGIFLLLGHWFFLGFLLPIGLLACYIFPCWHNNA